MALAHGTDTTDNYIGSINYYSQVLALDSSNWKAWIFRGNAYLATGNKDSAIRDINQSIAFHPAASTYYKRASFYMLTNDTRHALPDVIKSLQYDSLYGLSWYQLSAINLLLNKPDSANLFLEKADRVDYNPVFSHLIRATMGQRNHDYETVVTESTELLKLEHRNGLYFNNRGFAKICLGQYKEAESDIDMAMRLKPGTAYPLNNKAAILLHKGNPIAALEFVNNSLAIDSMNAYAYKNRGEIYLALKEKKKACADFNKTLVLTSDPWLSLRARLLATGCGK